MEGHPGPLKMLHALHQRYYLPELAEHVERFVDNCDSCIKSKAYAESN